MKKTAIKFIVLILGLFWAAGSALIEFLYDLSLFYVVVFSLIAQFASLPFFLSIKFTR